MGSTGEASKATGIDGDQGDNSCYGSGAVYVFTRDGSTWSQQAYVKASNTLQRNELGHSVALSAAGSTLAVGAIGRDSQCGAVYVAAEDNGATGVGEAPNNFPLTNYNSGAAYVLDWRGTP